MTFRPAGAARGKRGRDGIVGVNAIPADEFIAAKIADEDSETRQALDELYTGDIGGAMVIVLEVGEPVPVDLPDRSIIVRF